MHLYDFGTARQIVADRHDRLAHDMAREASWLRRPRHPRRLRRRARPELSAGSPAP